MKRALAYASVPLAVGAVGAAVWFFLLRDPDLPAHPLASVPADARYVAHLRLPRLREASLINTLVEANLIDIGGLALEDECGFDPFAPIEELTAFVAMTQVEDENSLAFIARGEFDYERLGECAQRVTGSDAPPERIDVGGFPGVRLDDGGHIAVFVGRRAILGGHESVVTEMVRVIKGEAPSAFSNDALRELYDATGSGRDLTLVAPISQRDLMRIAVGKPEMFREAMGSLASMQALALGVRFQDGVSAIAQVRAEDARQAERAAEATSGFVEGLRARPEIALTTLGLLVNAIEVDNAGSDVRVRFQMGQDLVDRVLAFFRNGGFLSPDDPRAPGNAGMAPPASSMAPAPPTAPTP